MTEAVNHRLPDWHAYVRDRQQRRQNIVAAAAREAGELAPTAAKRVEAEYRAARAGEKAFDANEPELSYATWKATV